MNDKITLYFLFRKKQVNINPLSPAYGVYISQLIRYARICSAYDQLWQATDKQVNVIGVSTIVHKKGIHTISVGFLYAIFNFHYGISNNPRKC
jgi:hypothetical protein